MKKIYSLFCLLFFALIQPNAQMYESFADGDFTAGIHVWGGSTSNWTVVTSSDVAAGATNSFTLRLNVASGGGTQYLSTQLAGSWSTGQTWGFWLGRRGQAATAANTSYVWLWANEADVTSATVDGYRIRLGDDGGDDEIYLESVTNGTASIILTSSGSVPNAQTDYGFLVRVTRSAASVWNLYTSTLPVASGTGNIATDFPNVPGTSVSQGSVTNSTYTVFNNGYFGVMALHSTGSGARVGAEFDQLNVVFAADSPLPVKFSNIKAYEKANGVQIGWTSFTEVNVDRYIIERSADGKTFSPVGDVAALNSSNEASYGYFDASPLRGISFYRLRNMDFDGKSGFSNIVRIDLNKGNKDITVYPNPARGGSYLSYTSYLTKGNYTAKIFNAAGQQLYVQQFSHSGGAINQTIQLPASVRPGLHTLQMDSEGMKVAGKTFMVQ